MYIMIRPHESKTYTITWGMDSYMVNFDGLITTCHTYNDKNNPHSLGDFTSFLDLHTPTIDGHRSIYEFVFTDSDYEYIPTCLCASGSGFFWRFWRVEFEKTVFFRIFEVDLGNYPHAHIQKRQKTQ